MKILDRLNNWINSKSINNPKMLNKGSGIDNIVNQQNNLYDDYFKPKNEIDYWQKEITKSVLFLSDQCSKLKDANYVKNLTPKRYDSVRSTIERALYSLEFAQQSLEKLLIIKAITPDQTKQFIDSALEKFNNKKAENDTKINKLNKLKDYINMYSSRENIAKNVENILNSNDDKEIPKLFSIVKSEYENLKQIFIKRGNPENSKILDEQYEELYRKFYIDHDIDYIKSFLNTNQKENSNLFYVLKSSAKSILDLKGEYNLDRIKKVLDDKSNESDKQKSKIELLLKRLSSMDHEKALKYLTLDLYASSQEDAEMADENIKRAKYKNYNLSPKLEELLNQKAKLPQKGIKYFIQNRFSKELHNKKKELALAMYPFLSYQENDFQLLEYINNNSDFLNKLIYSGVTPEILIEEQEKMIFSQNKRMVDLLKSAKQTQLDAKKYTKEKIVNRDPLSYEFINDSINQVFRFDDKFIRRLKSIPQNTPNTSFKSYALMLAEHLNGISKGLNTRTVKDDYSISDFDERLEKANKERTREISNDNQKTGPVDIYSHSSNTTEKSGESVNRDNEISLKDMIDKALAKGKANPKVRDTHIENTQQSQNHNEISLKDMIDEAIAKGKANPKVRDTHIENTQQTQNPNEISLKDMIDEAIAKGKANPKVRDTHIENTQQTQNPNEISLKDMIDEALAKGKANPKVRDTHIENTQQSQNHNEISLKDMIDEAIAKEKANPRVRDTHIENTQQSQNHNEINTPNDTRSSKQRLEDLLRQAMDFGDDR